MTVKVWIDAFVKPAATFKAQKSKASLKAGLMNYGIAGLISGIITAVIILAGLSALVSTGFTLPSMEGVGVTGAVGAVIGGIIAALIGSLIITAILWVVARILGGKGTYTQQYYLVSLYAVPVAILSIIPLVNILVILYGLYLLTVALREAHGYGTGKAVITWLILLVIVVIIALVIGAAILGSFLAGFSSSAGLPAY